MPQVEMLIKTEMLDVLPAILDLLAATEIRRRPAADGSAAAVLTLEVPHAPVGANRMAPIFEKASDGTVRVQGFNWRMPA